MSRGLSLSLLLVLSLAPGYSPGQTEAITGTAGDQAASSADTTGWDWDSFAPMDDAPRVKGTSVKKTEAEAKPSVPRVADTSEPDFDAEPHAAYKLFADAPDFLVVPSKRDRDMHPCANCHTWTKSDLTPRDLKPPHDNFKLQHGLHGKGKFWCFTCHTLEGQGGLRTLEGQDLDFNEAYVLCSQCHVRQTRDWVFGAHGKRVGNWQGERKVYNCTACHYQHSPAWMPRDAEVGPQVRMGLERPDHWVPKAERHETLSHEPPAWARKAETGREDHQ